MPFRVLVRAEFTQRGSLLHREGDCSPALVTAGASVTPKGIGVRNTNGYTLAVRRDIVRVQTICPLDNKDFNLKKNP